MSRRSLCAFAAAAVVTSVFGAAAHADTVSKFLVKEYDLNVGIGSLDQAIDLITHPANVVHQAQGLYNTINFNGEAVPGDFRADNGFPENAFPVSSHWDSVNQQALPLNYYVLDATGYVDIASTTPIDFNLGVYSDDGFGLFVNGTNVLQNFGNRSDGLTAGTVSLKKGDQLRLVYWDNDGSDGIEFRIGDNLVSSDTLEGNVSLVNSLNSALRISQDDPTLRVDPAPPTGPAAAPLPSAAFSGLALLGGLLGARRRKTATA